jgi:hypothetical protein
MAIKHILKHLEGTITEVTNDINKGGSSGADRLASLARLCNTYRKLSELEKAAEAPPNPAMPIYANERDEDKILHGDQAYIDSLYDPNFGKSERKLARRKG